MDRVNPNVGPDEAKLAVGDTTYLTVADKDGMMVSLIQSNYADLGSGLVPDGLGFMLQDRGALFSMDARSPNVYAPNKRPFHTIIPAFVMRDGNPTVVRPMASTCIPKTRPSSSNDRFRHEPA